MIVYRVGSGRYSANDGVGAAKYGGRWNHKGTPVVYAAECRALCALEILASSRELASEYVAVPIEIPDGLSIRILAMDDLPESWNMSSFIRLSSSVLTNG